MRKILYICSTLSVVMLFTSALHGKGINTTGGLDYNDRAITNSKNIKKFLESPEIFNSLPNIINQHVDPAFASILSEAQALLASAERKVGENPELKLASELGISSLPKNTVDRFILFLNEYIRIVDKQSYLREAALLLAIQSVTDSAKLFSLSSKLQDIAKNKIPPTFAQFPVSAIRGEFAQNYRALRDFITKLKTIKFHDADSFKKAFDKLPELSLDNAISMLTNVTNKDDQLVKINFCTIQSTYLNMALLYGRLRSLRVLIDNIFVLDFRNKSRNLELFNGLIKLRASIICEINKLNSRKQILEQEKNDYINRYNRMARAKLIGTTVDELKDDSNAKITTIQTSLTQNKKNMDALETYYKELCEIESLSNTTQKQKKLSELNTKYASYKPVTFHNLNKTISENKKTMAQYKQQDNILRQRKELCESLKNVLEQLEKLESSISEQESNLQKEKQRLETLKISRDTIDKLILKPTDELEQIKKQIEKIPDISEVMELLGDEWYYYGVYLWHISEAIPDIDKLQPREGIAMAAGKAQAEIRDAFDDIYRNNNPKLAEQLLMKLSTSIATEAANLLTFAKEKANELNLNFSWILGTEMKDLNFSHNLVNLFNFESDGWFLESIFLKLGKDSTFRELCSVLNNFEGKKANNLTNSSIVLLNNILSYSNYIFESKLLNNTQKYTTIINSLILNSPQSNQLLSLLNRIPHIDSDSDSDSDSNGVDSDEWDDDLDTIRSHKPTM